MGKKRKRSVRVLSGRSASKIRERYESRVSRKKEGRLGVLDDLFNELSKYQTKKGTAAKSKLRSNKSREDYNRILKEIENFGTASKRQAERIDETAERIAKNFNITGNDATAAASVFVSNALPEIPGFATSEAVLALAESGFDADSIFKILNYLKDDISMRTPDEMKKFNNEDKMSLFITHACNLHETDPEIPNGDIILLAQQMTDYNLNNYQNVIDEYHNEEDEEDEDEDDDY